MIHDLIQIIAAFFGSLGFAILFNIRGKDLFWTAFGGLLDWWVYVLAGIWCTGEAFRYFYAALFLGIYSEFMARRRKVPTTVYLVVGFIPLIPGSALFMTMNFAFAEEWQNCVHYGLVAINTAVAIAGGIVVSMVLVNIFFSIKRKIREQASS